jgi:RimJ/RimL family protein N-acetyltransferase
MTPAGDMTPPFIIPTLSTERLWLRPFNKDDLDPFVEMVSDPEVIRYGANSGKPMSSTQVFDWICMMLGHWHMRGFGIWGVEVKDSGEFIGRIGLQYLDWFDNVELVWMLRRTAWGKGYATEGARAAVHFGLEIKELPRLCAVIHPENQASIKVAEGLGMTLERQTLRFEIPFLEYSISRG